MRLTAARTTRAGSNSREALSTLTWLKVAGEPVDGEPEPPDVPLLEGEDPWEPDGPEDPVDDCELGNAPKSEPVDPDDPPNPEVEPPPSEVPPVDVWDWLVEEVELGVVLGLVELVDVPDPATMSLLTAAIAAVYMLLGIV